MEFATLVERVANSSQAVKVFTIDNSASTEFIAGYVREARILAGKKALLLSLCPYVRFSGYLGALWHCTRDGILEIQVKEDEKDGVGFGNVTTGFQGHRKMTDKLMQPLIENPNCEDLRLRNRRENYAKYLNLAVNL